VALALVGCNQVYGLDGTTLDDPSDFEPKDCSAVRFNAPMPIAEFAGGDTEFDPQLSPDGNELWYVTNPNGPYEMFLATRPAAGMPFVTMKANLTVEAGVNKDPSMTADGRRLMFVHIASDSFVMEVLRDDVASPFGLPRIVAGLGNRPIGAIDVSWDGLRIYYHEENGTIHTLWFASRPTRDAPFEGNRMLFEDVMFPTVSADELEIYYNRYGSARLYRRVRANKDDPFGPEEFILDEGTDPDIAPSSNQLVVGRAQGLAILERVCPMK